MHASALAAIFEAFPDPVLVVGASRASGRRVMAFNAAARKAFPQLTGQPALASIIRRPDVLDLVEAALVGGKSGEAIYETGSAQDRRMQAISRPLPPNDDGAPLALLILRDETEALRNERMRADFLANASHELKTPLSSLAGFIETLRGHAKDDPVAREKFLGVMAEQADRMGRLIADLLSLSRIELDEHIPPSGEIDLALCVQDVVQALQTIAAKAEIRLELAGAQSAMVRGEFHQVIQVIQNLVENAIKYGPAGSVVTVEVLASLNRHELNIPNGADAAALNLVEPDVDMAGGFAAVRVTDQGQGIAREHLPRLTERFYRVPGQKSGSASGTGLGLAIVKHILSRHHGGLFVANLPGRGAAFTAYFPRGGGAG